MHNELLKITGLWRNTDSKGNTYLSGSLTPISKIMVLPNTFKKDGDKAPDYYLYVSPTEKKEKEKI